MTCPSEITNMGVYCPRYVVGLRLLGSFVFSCLSGKCMKLRERHDTVPRIRHTTRAALLVFACLRVMCLESWAPPRLLPFHHLINFGVYNCNTVLWILFNSLIAIFFYSQCVWYTLVIYLLYVFLSFIFLFFEILFFLMQVNFLNVFWVFLSVMLANRLLFLKWNSEVLSFLLCGRGLWCSLPTNLQWRRKHEKLRAHMIALDRIRTNLWVKGVSLVAMVGDIWVFKGEEGVPPLLDLIPSYHMT